MSFPRAGRFSPTLALLLGAFVAPASAQQHYTDVTVQAGISFEHSNGARGNKLLPETMGSGVAFLDADLDGWLDLYFVNAAGPAAFYGNRSEGRFEDRTDLAGVANSGFGMGATAADYDNDGDPDLYITTYGANILYRNDGDRFADVTAAAGVGDQGFGTGAAFADWDLDGDLDLYVANYLDCRSDPDRACMRDDSIRVYCAPWTYETEPDALFRNDGDRFVEVGAESGLLPGQARELGAVFTDYDLDGDVDLYVAGDGTPNMLYQNEGGRFEEVGLMAGAAYNKEGKSEAGMGVAVGDYDNDGDFDTFVTNFFLETNTLYHNEGGGFFLDRTTALNLGKPSLSYLSWGTAFFDWDLDGDEDLFVANGHMDDNVDIFGETTYEQRNQLFRNDGATAFADISDLAGPGLLGVKSSRGTAIADWDNDGDLDIAVSHVNARASLLRNDLGGRRNWLSVRLVGTAGNRDGVGARVSVQAGDLVQIREMRRGGSYLSTHDPRLHFGLGRHRRIDQVTVVWPGGQTQRIPGLEGSRTITIEQAL